MCSTIIFDARGRKCLAQNYDYLADHGLVAINLRETVKTNGHDTSDTRVEWVVKFGSVTFNQFSLEMPVSGMNEAGLAIALMWHDEGDFGNDTRFRRLNSLQWIQYQLDNFKDVDEVVSGLETVRPEQGPVPLHFMLLDSQGNSLIVEFIAGQLVLQRNAESPILTNSSYDKCLAATRHCESRGLPPRENSLGRFAHLHGQLATQEAAEDAGSTGFAYLSSVSQSSSDDNAETFPWTKLDNDTITAWSIVFDPEHASIRFKTDKNSEVRLLNFTEMDFDASNVYQIADINSGTEGSLLPYFAPYSADRNHEILKRSAPLVGLPEEVVHPLLAAVDHLYRERRMP